MSSMSGLEILGNIIVPLRHKRHVPSIDDRILESYSDVGSDDEAHPAPLTHR